MSDGRNDDQRFDGDETGDSRHTDINSPSSELIEISKRGEDGSASVMSSTTPPVRISGAGPGMSSTTKSVLIYVCAICGLVVGILAASLYFNGRLNNTKQGLEDAESDLGACAERTKRCVTELMGCVSDVGNITQDSADSALTPRNFLVERTRKRKETVQSKYDEKLQEVVAASADLKAKNKKGLNNSIEALKTAVNELKGLKKTLEKANDEHKASLLKVSGGSPDASFQEAAKRNKARSSVIAEMKESEAP